MVDAKRPSGAPAASKVGAAQAVRDVFIASINKGQFPFAVAGAVILLLVWRLPENEIVPLIRWIVEKLGEYYYFGYLMSVVLTFAWYFHAQRIRKEMHIHFDGFKSGQKTLGRPVKGQK